MDLIHFFIYNIYIMSIILPSPITMSVNYNITSFNYYITNVVLFTSADIFVNLANEMNRMQSQISYKLEGTEYTNWGGDDQYIINLIISKIPEWVSKIKIYISPRPIDVTKLINLPTPEIMTIYYNITSFLYEITNVTLFTSADIRISLVDEENIIQKQIDYILQGEDYENWKEDDQYIIDLITTKIPDLIK